MGGVSTAHSLFSCCSTTYASRFVTKHSPDDVQDALRGLSKWKLERDDETDPNGRIYRDANGEIYHSVTRILKETSDSKAALEAWVARLGEETANQ